MKPKGEKVVLVTRENKPFCPILVYHKVDYQKEFGVSVIHPDKFRIQIKGLYEMGYRTTTISSLVSDQLYDKNQICIFFDDGYENCYQYAYPVLEEHGFVANIAVISDYIGRYNDWDIQIGAKYRHLNKNHIKFLISKGWELISHTCSHKKMTFLNDATIYDELLRSKNELEASFSVPVNHLVYPYSAATEKIAEMARECGYTGASGFFSNKKIHNDYCIPRTAVYAFDRLSSVKRKIEGSQTEKIKQRIIHFCNHGSSFITLNKSNYHK